MPTDGGEPRKVTDLPLGAGAPAWSPDSRRIAFTTRVPDEGRYAGKADAEPPRRITTVQYRVDNLGFYTDRRAHVFVVDPFGAAGSEPEQLIAVTDGSERQLTSFAAISGPLPLEEITATAPDGYPVHGWVVRPPGEGPHPVLLLIHGGPFTQYGWRLFDEAQVYAGAGYAVVMGNPRGSSGYGQAHGLAVVGDAASIAAGDLLALLDAGLATGGLDSSRVGVLGGSYGGYMTTWLAGHHSDRFKAAVSERAVNAIDSFHGSSDIGWIFASALWGDDPAGWAAQSPLTYADQISIPVLIVHSEHDWRCPIEQAQRLFVALKLRGAPTEMLLFPGEGHELSRNGRPSHRVARFEAILDWWDRHL